VTDDPGLPHPHPSGDPDDTGIPADGEVPDGEVPDGELADLAALAGADTEAIAPTDVAEGFLDRIPAIRRFDEDVDAIFDRLRGNPVADRAFYALSELGDFGLIWLLIGGVRGLTGDEEAEEFLRLVVTMAAESLIVNGAVKNLFRRERPVVQEERPHKLRIPLTTSFPSGHASSAMTAAMLLGQRRKTMPVYVGLGLAVAASRVYVRIHHASDVVGGLAVGLAIGGAARKLWPGPRGRR
jgi:undecaprenyl-diphosphatase